MAEPSRAAFVCVTSRIIWFSTMGETKRDEHERLQKRTERLKQDHADLSRDKTPFSKADHDRHTEELRQHQDDLAKHKARSEDEQ